MEISEKIARRKEARQKRLDRIANDRAVVAELDREIKSLEALEIQGLMQEHHVTSAELKALIRQLEENPTHTTKDGGKSQ